LKLSPEIRNAVYDILFEQERPIMLFESRRKHSEFADFGLMRSCRQIYHEIVSIFYGRNTFAIHRASVGNVGGRSWRDSSGYPKVVCAQSWLHSLGSQYKFLEKFEVDVSIVCPPSRRYTDIYRDAGADLLPLLRLMWRQPSGRGKITFLVNQRRGSAELLTYFTQVKNILESFIDYDQLGLKRFSTSEVFLKAVMVHASGTKGLVLYYCNPDRRFSKLFRHFVISKGGSVTWTPVNQTASLQSLESSLQEKILQYANLLSNKITLDLNAHTVHGLNMCLLHINEKLRSVAIRKMFGKNKAPKAFKLTTTKNTTSFEEFGRLIDLYFESHVQDLLHYILLSSLRAWGSAKSKETEIVLQFEVDSEVQLAALRIKMNGFLSMLCSPREFKIHDDATLVIASSSNLSCKIPIWQLRFDIFLYLTHLLRQLPQETLPGMPEIFIDGHCNIVDKITIPMGSLLFLLKSWHFEDGRTILEPANEFGLRFETGDARHEAWKHEEAECIYCTWNSLRRCLTMRRLYEYRTMMESAMTTDHREGSGDFS
jgi:hypothetical protein